MSSVLESYVTDSELSNKGYITSSALSDYATNSSVNTKLTDYLPLTGGTLIGKLNIKMSTDVSGVSAGSPALSIGDENGIHIAFDNNEIIAKNSSNTTAALNLNTDGGEVIVGASGENALRSRGTFTASENATVGTTLTVGSSVSSPSYAGTGVITIEQGAPITGYSNTTIPSTYTLARWNGAYNANGGSNLVYCSKGAFGTIITKNTEDYLPSVGGTVTGSISANGMLLSNNRLRTVTENLAPTQGINAGKTVTGLLDHMIYMQSSGDAIAAFRYYENSNLLAMLSFNDRFVKFWDQANNLAVDLARPRVSLGICNSFEKSGSTNYALRVSDDGKVVPAYVTFTGAFASWALDETGRMDLGASGHRFGALYLTGGVVTSSDRKEKTEITELDSDKTVKLMQTLVPRQYKRIDGTSGRTHYGFVAQEVKDAMTLAGIDDFAGYVSTPKEETKTREECMDDELILGLRYEEFLAPMLTYIQYLESRIRQLEILGEQKS